MSEVDEQMLPDERPFRSGFVALVGRPNAGKSTLVNACLGEHLAPTSKVAQTTRRRLRAVVNTPNAQVVLVDTPGLHKPKDALGSELNRAALAELSDVDIVAMLVDGAAEVGRGDAWVASHVAASDAYKLLVITKADLVDPARVQAQLEAAQKLAPFDDALVLSATEDFNVDTFLKLVIEHLPEGPQWFGDDVLSDMRDEDVIAELIREKVMRLLREEVPHSVAVTCDSLSYASDGHAQIEATILVERESQKGIVIGAGGRMVKRIGTEARRDIERLLGTQTYLSLEVKVAPAWRRDAAEIRRLGYSAGD